MLGWYILDLSELPLGNRLLLILAGPFQRFFVFSISLGTFILSVLFSFFLLSFRVRACTPSTAPRASAAPSRVSADGGGLRGECKERGRRFRG